MHRMLLLLPFLATLALPTSSKADDAITLKFATGQPASNYFEVQGSQYWMKEVTERTANRVKFEYYPAGQLGAPDKMMDLVEAGVADVGSFSSAYFTNKMPLNGAFDLPGLVQNACQGAAIYRSLQRPGKVLHDSDMKDRNLVFLFAMTPPPNEIETASRKITMPEDAAGLKIRVAGAGGALLVQALGAAPVRITAPETYQSFSRGTVDAVLIPWNSFRQYDLQRLAKFTTSGFGFGTPPQIWEFNKAAWARLPEDAQKAMQVAAIDTENHLCHFAQDGIAADRQALVDAGMQVVELDGNAKAAFAAKLLPVIDEWAKSLDQRGKPGTQTIEQIRAAAKQF